MVARERGERKGDKMERVLPAHKITESWVESARDEIIKPVSLLFKRVG